MDTKAAEHRRDGCARMDTGTSRLPLTLSPSRPRTRFGSRTLRLARLLTVQPSLSSAPSLPTHTACALYA
eukprot:3775792-Pleurochrysis_carterae.AAC.3